MTAPQDTQPVEPSQLRRTVLIVALLNFAYFFVEFSVALTAGSVSLLADSVDFLEDTAINLLILVALGWSLARRATLGKLMTLVLLTPAILAGWKAIEGFANPVPPLVTPLVLASLGAIAVNGVSAVLLSRVRHHRGSLSAAAFLSARNNVLVNVAIIAMAYSRRRRTRDGRTWCWASASSCSGSMPRGRCGRPARTNAWPIVPWPASRSTNPRWLLPPSGPRPAMMEP